MVPLIVVSVAHASIENVILVLRVCNKSESRVPTATHMGRPNPLPSFSFSTPRVMALSNKQYVELIDEGPDLDPNDEGRTHVAMVHKISRDTTYSGGIPRPRTVLLTTNVPRRYTNTRGTPMPLVLLENNPPLHLYELWTNKPQFIPAQKVS